MNRETIKTYLLDFQQKKIENIKKREVVLSESSKIQTIIGARRIGKTYLLYNKILELEASNIPRKRMLYLNFENPVLDDISYKEVKEILNIHWSLYPEMINEKLYLFIDEPQVIEKWESAIRGLYDDFNVEIFLTGSSSRLLSKEIATSLRGRSITTLLLSLSFAEYLEFNDFEYDLNRLSTKKKAEIINCLNKFLQFGSYPEIVLENDNEHKIKILKDYFDLTIYKDLVDRYNLNNTNLMKVLIDLIDNSCSKEFSVNKHYLDLKSRGLKVSKNTMYEYFSTLEDSFFMFPVRSFSYSRKTENLSIPKVYLGDIGFLNLYSLENYGQRLENIVFLQLLRQTVKNPLLKINYWQSVNKEVDFVVSEGRKIKSLIQVCYSIDNVSTKKRELSSLVSCLKELEVIEGVIITLNAEEEIIIDNKKIKIIPVWKWLLK